MTKRRTKRSQIIVVRVLPADAEATLTIMYASVGAGMKIRGELGKLVMNWNVFAECIASEVFLRAAMFPYDIDAELERRGRKSGASRSPGVAPPPKQPPAEFSDAVLERVLRESVAYVRERVETETRRFLSDTIGAIRYKLVGESFYHALRAVAGDSAVLDKLQRDHERAARKFVESLAKKWVFLAPGRPPARTPREKAALKQKLDTRLREERTKRFAAGKPYSIEAALPDIAAEWGMSVGTLDQIRYTRKPRKTKRSTLARKNAARRRKQSKTVQT